MNFQDIPVSFRCHDAWLYGIVSVPERPSARGVLIVVGGPQYRAGSHRQFVLLARYLAGKGIPVMRFDLRGMGDSEGERIDFAAIDDDIECALDQFALTVPTLRDAAIWGLCDAATAAAFYAPTDRRICGLVLLNPWIRTEESKAQTYLRHYYAARIFRRDFWSKALSGKLNIFEAARSFAQTASKAWRGRDSATTPDSNSADGRPLKTLPQKMQDSLAQFNGSTLFILSGNDFTAKEFADHVEGSLEWQEMLRSKNAAWKELKEANHTFSREDWRRQIAEWTHDWLDTL
jgi:exosortase A-associated hydrolase 1